uniref:inner membrane CreD family protein n=1 Tax=Pseudomonas viridiflava TaxID=33069 RepID=UPI0013CE9444
SLITDRQLQRDGVLDDIARSSSFSQRLTGPLLVVPYRKNIRLSYQTTCNQLKELDFVGADLSANTVFQAMNIRRMYWPFRGQVR